MVRQNAAENRRKIPSADASPSHEESKVARKRKVTVEGMLSSTIAKVLVGIGVGVSLAYLYNRHSGAPEGSPVSFDQGGFPMLWSGNFSFDWLPSNFSLPGNFSFPASLPWSPKSSSYDQAPNRPGKILAAEGVRAKYPVIIIPGFVTSGLELWQGLECAEGLFRTRLWTALPMAHSFFRNRRCWMTHLSLNFTSGLDPSGIKLRNAQGLDAVDFFFPGYDVWAKVIEALADIGYDSSTLIALPYDWRLSLSNLEFRDGYFTKLRQQVEMFRQVYNEKVMFAAHSWGDNVARAFLHWMEEQAPGWVEDHIAVHFNVAGPVLGVPKALTSLLSGELRETAQLSGLSHFVGEALLGKEDRTLVWRTWGSALGMLPIGGAGVWGNATWSPDDVVPLRMLNHSYGSFLTVLESTASVQAVNNNEYLERISRKILGANDTTLRFVDVVEAIKELVLDAGPKYLHHVKFWSSAEMPANMGDLMEQRHGVRDWPPYADASTPIISSVELEEDSSQMPHPLHRARATVKTYNPTTTPLPNAPSMRLYCAYGHDIKTERAYHYMHVPVHVDEEQCPASELTLESVHAGEQVAAGVNWNINCKANGPKESGAQWLENGVQFTNGDGTVPIVSLGAMCAGPWRSSKLNPHGVKVVTREQKDETKVTMTDYRGGPKAASHIEVLGNREFLKDLLYAAAGRHGAIDEDIFTSNVQEIASRLQLN